MAEEDALRVTASVLIPAHELTWTFGPSGGPGGQHANRAHTRAEVRFDVEASGSLSQYQRQRIIDRLEQAKLETNRWEKIRLVTQISHSAEDYAFDWEEKLADLAG